MVCIQGIQQPSFSPKNFGVGYRSLVDLLGSITCIFSGPSNKRKEKRKRKKADWFSKHKGIGFINESCVTLFLKTSLHACVCAHASVKFGSFNTENN